MVAHRVFLVPGFFGFVNLGDLYYFQHLIDFLDRRFRDAGTTVEVVRVHTHPTASIRVRAGRLAATIAEKSVDKAKIHVIGHSSGGLDARMLLTPDPDVDTSELDDDVDLGELTKRVKTLITVATPHLGTPLADFFSKSGIGETGLRVLSLTSLYALRFGKLPLKVFLSIGSFATKLDDAAGLDNSLVDQIFRTLLDDFSAHRQDEVRRFFEEVRDEPAKLMEEITPEAMKAFDLRFPLNKGVRPGSIITRARRPSLRATMDAGLNPYAQVTRAIYSIFHRRAGHPHIWEGDLDDELHHQLIAAAGGELRPDANDGMVPTISQAWGDIITVAKADHLDVIGHFMDREHEPPHIDWLSTGSGFNRARFEEVWDHAVEWILHG
jgi:pimeloyl-ACP methyl ester carboxylesterase